MFEPSDIIKQEKQVAADTGQGSGCALRRSRKSWKKRKSVRRNRFWRKKRFIREGVVSVRDLIAPAAFGSRSPVLSNWAICLCRTIFVINYPRYISVGWFAPIINMQPDRGYRHVFLSGQVRGYFKTIKEIKSALLEAQIIADAEKGAPRDPIRETALRDIEKLRDDLTQGIETFFPICFYVTHLCQ